jgi:hypothetical protein
MNKNILNLLQRLLKQEVLNSNNLHIVTRLAARRDINKTPSQNRQAWNSSPFPNLNKEEKIVMEALKFLKNTNQEHQNKGKQDENIVQEFLQLLKEKHSISWLLDLFNILREYKEGQRPSKDVRQLSYKHKYYDPQVDLEINGVVIEHVVVDFELEVNILPRDTWIRLGRPSLSLTLNYLKLVDQILIEPINILRNVETQIMGIPTPVDFEGIDLVEGMPTYPTLVSWPWGQQMKATISLERNRIKLKGSGRKIITPLDPKEGKPWMESWGEDQEARCLNKQEFGSANPQQPKYGKGGSNSQAEGQSKDDQP